MRSEPLPAHPGRQPTREARYCCFRFDADTHACVSRGIPRLVELAEALGVKFTFFVNMGRAFDPRITLSKAFGRLAARGERRAMSAASKLGWKESLRAAILNPRAGRSDPAALQMAARGGHEIGLHGGRNHATWERFAHAWSEGRLRAEIETGQRWLAECGLGERIESFSSPAWNSPAGLQRVLPELGFRVIADAYDKAQDDVTALGGLVSVPTNITAEPGSAGYLETMRLRGRSTKQVVQDFRTQLATKDRLAVVYDHPFFAGIHALDDLAELVRTAMEQGFVICTIGAAAQRLQEAQRAVADG